MHFLPVINYSKNLNIKSKNIYVKDFFISTKVRPMRVEHLHGKGIISSEATFSGAIHIQLCTIVS
jgi:hypothetical protein